MPFTVTGFVNNASAGPYQNISLRGKDVRSGVSVPGPLKLAFLEVGYDPVVGRFIQFRFQFLVSIRVAERFIGGVLSIPTPFGHRLYLNKDRLTTGIPAVGFGVETDALYPLTAPVVSFAVGLDEAIRGAFRRKEPNRRSRRDLPPLGGGKPLVAPPARTHPMRRARGSFPECPQER